MSAIRGNFQEAITKTFIAKLLTVDPEILDEPCSALDIKIQQI